jgi:uncharacterized protein
MFRVIIIIAALLLIYLIVKNRPSSRRSHRQKNRGSAAPDDMVKCLQCKTYIPKKEAIISGTEIFCCKQHQRDWESNHQHRD